MNSRKLILIISFFVIIVGLIFLYVNRGVIIPSKMEQDFPGPMLKIGTVAPNLTLSDIDGKKQELKDYRGKVVLINFWASWCPPCIEELPGLSKVYEKLKDKGFEIVAINLDEDLKAALDLIKEQNISFNIFLDPQGKTAQEYLVYGLPYTILLDREGKVQFKEFGGHEWNQGKDLERIEALL